MYQENENPYDPHSKQETDLPIYDTTYEKAPEKEKKRGGIRVVALALCCALCGGAFGAGITNRLQGGGKTAIEVSNRNASSVEVIKVDGKTKMSMPEVYSAVVDSVVSITTSSTQTNIFGQQVETAAAGSGFIITADGYIVTNYHVIEAATDVKVTLYNGKSYAAQVIGGDEDYDIAVLKIDVKDLTPVVLGNSEKINVGEAVAAIGNPLGELTFSMSVGVVSCANRAINIDGTPFNMIQVDCSINHGNSGGPLVNEYGEVIGIVSAKYSSYSDTSVEGLGFAIPMNDVSAMIQDIMTSGYVGNKPYIGINAGTLTAAMAQQYRFSIEKGVFIYSVEENSAAQKAGLRMGDVITQLDKKEINSMDDLSAAKKNYCAGDTVSLKVYREGKSVDVSLTFDAAPQNTEQEKTEPSQQVPQQTPQYGTPYGGGYYNPFQFFNDFFTR